MAAGCAATPGRVTTAAANGLAAGAFGAATGVGVLTAAADFDTRAIILIPCSS